MKIQQATIKDFQELKKIKIKFYLWQCKRDKRLNPDYAKKVLGQRLAKNLKQKNTAFFTAKDKEKIIGYVGAEIKKNPSFMKNKLMGHAFNLYIIPKYRNKGIGKKLIRRILKWFDEKKVNDFRIMVYSYNKKAQQIYKRFGFKEYILELAK